MRMYWTCLEHLSFLPWTNSIANVCKLLDMIMVMVVTRWWALDVMFWCSPTRNLQLLMMGRERTELFYTPLACPLHDGNLVSFVVFVLSRVWRHTSIIIVPKRALFSSLMLNLKRLCGTALQVCGQWYRSAVHNLRDLLKMLKVGEATCCWLRLIIQL